MGLLGAYIDSRTLAAMNAEGTVSYVHGLPAAPGFCYCSRCSYQIVKRICQLH